MNTKVFIDLSGDAPYLNVHLDCPSQPLSWIESQKDEIRREFASIVRYCKCFFSFNLATQPVDVIMHNALLDAEEVTGYRTEWRQVKVSINRFGKLGIRNRQFVIPMKGTRGSVPHSFIPCGPEGWAWLQNQGEFMLEPGSPLPDADERARLYAKYLREEEGRKTAAIELTQQQQAQQSAEKEEKARAFQEAIAAGVDILTAWKAAGCQHPAPAEIMEMKKESGLNWKNFIASI